MLRPPAFAALSVLCCALLAGAQTGVAKEAVPSTTSPRAPIAWETISIHTHDPNDATMKWGEVPNGIGMQNVDLRTLLSGAFAFDEPMLRDDEILGLPGWARDAHYDVVAHVAPEDVAAYKNATDLGLQETIRHMVQREATPEMLMMRSLLQDRFGLSAHYELKEQRVYELLVDKGGPRLRPAADAAHGTANWSAGLIQSKGIPAQFLAVMLGLPLERHVVDRTGLSGSFDVTLHFAPRNDPNSSEPDLFTAVREQLGLRLESSRAPELVLVIDQVHPPTPN